MVSIRDFSGRVIPWGKFTTDAMCWHLAVAVVLPMLATWNLTLGKRPEVGGNGKVVRPLFCLSRYNSIPIGPKCPRQTTIDAKIQSRGRDVVE